MTDAKMRRLSQIATVNPPTITNEALDRGLLHHRLEVAKPKYQNNLCRLPIINEYLADNGSEVPRFSQIAAINLPNMENEALERKLLHHRLDKVAKPKYKNTIIICDNYPSSTNT